MWKGESQGGMAGRWVGGGKGRKGGRQKRRWTDSLLEREEGGLSLEERGCERMGDGCSRAAEAYSQMGYRRDLSGVAYGQAQGGKETRCSRPRAEDMADFWHVTWKLDSRKAPWRKGARIDEHRIAHKSQQNPTLIARESLPPKPKATFASVLCHVFLAHASSKASLGVVHHLEEHVILQSRQDDPDDVYPCNTAINSQGVNRRISLFTGGGAPIAPSLLT